MAAFATTLQYRYLPLKYITSKSEGYESVINAFRVQRFSMRNTLCICTSLISLFAAAHAFYLKDMSQSADQIKTRRWQAC
ncbi:hypothetical protein V1478_000521 [Vespula squamosa]|uniref:Uncharacterized protein n=1 Tax=Vespula squamosa TaxID=30214 RepID=A0ABD2C6B4_VESSQ